MIGIFKLILVLVKETIRRITKVSIYLSVLQLQGVDDNFYAISRESTVPVLIFKASVLDPTGFNSIVHFSTNADQSYLAISISKYTHSCSCSVLVPINKHEQHCVLHHST